MSYSFLDKINFSETHDWREGFKNGLASMVLIIAHGSVNLFHLMLHDVIMLSQQKRIWIVLYSWYISKDEMQMYK